MNLFLRTILLPAVVGTILGLALFQAVAPASETSPSQREAHFPVYHLCEWNSSGRPICDFVAVDDAYVSKEACEADIGQKIEGLRQTMRSQVGNGLTLEFACFKRPENPGLPV